MKTPKERRWKRAIASPLVAPANVNGDGRRRRRKRAGTTPAYRRGIRLAITVAPAVSNLLDDLLATGLYGRSRAEVAQRGLYAWLRGEQASGIVETVRLKSRVGKRRREQPTPPSSRGPGSAR